jgi:hypothetical protein
MKHWSNKLGALGACFDSIEYAKTQPDFQTAWDNCKRGDWMLWLATKLPAQVTRQQLVFTACQCARLALPYTKDARILTCIEVTEAWTRNEATINQVKQARNAAAYVAYAAAAAADAAADAAAYAAYAAAYVAAYVAYAADAATSAADAAAYAAADAAADAAAYAAAYAAADAAAYAARNKTLLKCADIVRQHITVSLHKE